MILTRRSAALGLVLGLVLLGGCSESLFGARGGGGGGGGGGDGGGGDGGGGDGGDVPTTCPAGCIADAAADFNGTARGANGHWKYLEDHRDRSWAPMTGGTVMTGADPGNHITTCAASPSAPSCKALSGALLVSSAGSNSNADPAIEFTAPTSQVIQLSLRVFVPSGADQTIRLYRNSREDVLFTGTATAGNTLADAITLDALAGDRFLVAVAPTGGGATDIGLHLFVNSTGTGFPSTCQLALPFESTSNGTTLDRCHNVMFQQWVYSPPSGAPTTSMKLVSAAPFPAQGSSVELAGQNFIQGDLSRPLDWSRDLTVQFWVQLLMIPSIPNEASLFSDLDADIGGGVAIYVVGDFSGGPGLSVRAATHGGPITFDRVSTAYPSDGSWQFVRVVRSGGSVNVCLNGAWKTSLPVRPDEAFMTTNPPSLGRDASPNVAVYFDGHLDDVRAITGALPCSP